MKETFQAELASIAKAKRELKKEENLVNGILSERSRICVVEIEVPEIEALYKVQENGKEPDDIWKDISVEKGGGAEKTESIQIEIPAHTKADHSEKQPAHNKYQKQQEQAR